MSNATIMVVDDNENIGKTMAYVLKRQGYNVIIAINGKDAVLKARENPEVEIIFMDIIMPFLNGVEALREIKKFIPEVIVFMMTAYAVEELIQEALEEGAHGILYKPLDLPNMIDIIENASKEKTGALILLVDDSEGIRDTFEKILRKKGYNIMTTDEGEKAIELAKENNFDVIFIDMKLPTINGLETYLRIKKQSPNAIVIIITGFAEPMSDLIDEALHASCYSCIHKPLDMKYIIELLDEVLSKKRESGGQYLP